MELMRYAERIVLRCALGSVDQWSATACAMGANYRNTCVSDSRAVALRVGVLAEH